MDNVLKIYTDGACSGKNRNGGWGALLIYKDRTVELYDGEKNTTNNRMELMAAIRSLEYTNCDDYDVVEIITDSKYLQVGMTEWLKEWKSRGWKTATNKPVKNLDLWIKLESLSTDKNIIWRWVKGHSGNKNNETADRLANMGIQKIL